MTAAAVFAPTPQQTRAEDALRAGEDVLIVAGAGAGKTSTLVHLGKVCDELGLRVAYVCFNGSTAREAGTRFGRNVTCGTAHSFATKASRTKTGEPFWHHRLRGPKTKRGFQNARVVARILGITDDAEVLHGMYRVADTELATLALRTVQAFCLTADPGIATVHVPVPDGIPEEHATAYAEAVLPHAQRAWEDLGLRHGIAGRAAMAAARTAGLSADEVEAAGRGAENLNVEHGVYLKRWQLSGRQIMVKGPGGIEVPADVIMFDEVQDASATMAAIFKLQGSKYGKRLILVGDRNQAINGFAGARDITGDFPDATRVELSKSFRFGPAVAAVANQWLHLLDADLRITGHDPVPSVVATLSGDERPDAILCRTSAGAMRAVLDEHQAERRVHLVGEGKEMLALAKASLQLDAEGWTPHADLRTFKSWGEVVDYCERGELGSEDLETAVRLIEEFGAETVIDAIGQLTSARPGVVTVSTAHMSKGLEWGTVKIGDDFRQPRKNDRTGKVDLPGRDELMLSYVAVTRAKVRLDVGSLGWVDSWVRREQLDPRPSPAPPVVAAVPAAEVVPVLRRHVGVGPGTARALEVLRAAQVRAARPGYSEDDRIDDTEAIVAAYLRQDAPVAPLLSVVRA